MTEFLDLDDLVVIAGIATGGPVLVRDHGLLASAAARPRTTVFGKDAYAGLFEKAAALRINGIELVATQDDVVELVTAVADGSLDEVGEIAKVLEPWA